MTTRTALELAGSLLTIAAICTAGACFSAWQQAEKAQIEAEVRLSTCVASREAVVQRGQQVCLGQLEERDTHHAQALETCHNDCEAQLVGAELARELSNDEGALLDLLEGLTQ